MISGLLMGADARGGDGVAKNPSGRRSIKSEGFGERSRMGFGLHEQTPVNYPPPSKTFPPGTPLDEVFKAADNLSNTILATSSSVGYKQSPTTRHVPASGYGSGKAGLDRVESVVKSRLPLMDDILAMTYRDKMYGTKLSDASRRVLGTYRAKMRLAEKFVLDDDAVRFTVDLSHQLHQLEMYAVLARIPYDVVYFEMNLHAKVKYLESKGTLQSGRAQLDQVSPVVGYLFYRDGEEGARWICHEFKRVVTGDPTLQSLGLDPGIEETMPGLISFVFDPDGAGHNPTRGSLTWRSPSLSLRENFPKVPARVYLDSGDLSKGMVESKVDPEFVLSGDLKGRTETDSIHYSDGSIGLKNWFVNRGAAIVDPFWEAHLAGTNPKRNNRLVMLECIEQAGVMRFLVAMLASINAVPREVKQAKTRTGQRQVSGRILPYFQHRTISLKLPRDNRIQWARKIMRASYRNQPRALHPVRGHWRIIERGKAKARGRQQGQAFCHHHPEMVENDLAICNKCEMIIRWISNHQRGDPNVGIVSHTYKVSA